MKGTCRNSLILLVGVFFLFYGCCAARKAPVIEYRDSIRVEYRDRIVHDTALVEIPVIKEVNVTRDSTSHLENAYAVSDAVVFNGFLSHSIATKPQTIKAPVTIRVTDTLTVEKEVEIRGETQYVEKELTKWQKFRLDAFWWLFAVIILAILWTVRKPLAKLILK